MKERIKYIDLAKGLLIVSVVFWHSLCVVDDHPTRSHLHILAGDFLLPFFMQAFFVITGYCSNFKKSFSKLVWDDFRTLILPAILLSIAIKGFKGDLTVEAGIESVVKLGEAWFVIALFFSKSINWCVFRIEKTLPRLAVASIITLTGLFVGIRWYNYDTSFYYLQQATAMVLFVQAGYLLKRYELHKSYIWTLGSALIFLGIGGYYVMGHHYLPWFGFVFQMSMRQIPLVLLVASTGSLALLGLCQLIKKCKPLEYVGQASLVIFLLHWPFIEMAYSRFIGIMAEASAVLYLVCFITIVLFAVLTCTAIFWLLSTKYLRWIIGKF